MKHKIIQAVKNRNIVEFYYKGHYRIVEPHRCGISRTGYENLLAYQIAGTGESSNIPGWKLFHLSEIREFRVLKKHFSGHRQGYLSGDDDMAKVYAEI